MDTETKKPVSLQDGKATPLDNKLKPTGEPPKPAPEPDIYVMPAEEAKRLAKRTCKRCWARGIMRKDGKNMLCNGPGCVVDRYSKQPGKKRYVRLADDE